ncbi:MAG: signal peptidase II [Lachnospiraceae bacterium]|nr:signal peptidase II [Lachnospiraceae bacterium]
MKDYSLKYKLRGILAPLFMIAVDQVSKYLAVKNLKGAAPQEFIPGILGFSYVENRGMSFGLLQGQRWLFIVITVLVCLFLILVYFRIPEKKRFNALSVCVLFIFSGAIGNFIDRLRQGYVVDFLELRFMSFPVFNIADCYITWTTVVLICLLLFYYKENELKEIRLWRR